MVAHVIAAPESFAERIALLFSELERAIRFGRPSILLAIYRSEFVRAAAEEALEVRLRESGQQVKRVFINEQNHDLPQFLRAQADRTTTVFFVSGIRFGGGQDGRNAYRALNIRREYLVDYRQRVVFWLTEQEAFNLPRYAPDFWAFRHRTVEFMDQPEPDHIENHAGRLTWRDWQGAMSPEAPAFTADTVAKIAYRERMLADLPETPETTAMRATLFYTLAPLYVAQKESDKAIAALQQAIALDPQDAAPHHGLGNVYAGLGRTGDAIAAYRQAIALDPQDAAPHHGLGTVYADLGRTGDAIAAYQQAIARDPQVATAYSSLAACYRKLGQEDDYQAAVATARPLMANESAYNRACFAAICGDVESALVLLEQAIKDSPGIRQWAQNDSDFDFIRDDPRFQTLVG